MKKFIFSLLFLKLSCFAWAQNGLGYYHDQQNNFYVFDKGIERMIETNPVTDVMVGDDYLAYTDSKRSFMYYYNGDKQLLEENLPNQVVATGNALVYRMQNRLMVVEKGVQKELFRNVETFTATDSLIVWQAIPSLNYMCYENGEISTFLYATSSNVISDFKVGNNIMAFNDPNHNLKIYYKGKVYDTDYSRITNYDCGHDLVAFFDEYKNTFNIFYNGEMRVIAEDLIQNFSVSNDVVAWVDSKDNFSVFYHGAITKIDSRKPDYYLTAGNLLYYSFNSDLKIICNGAIYSEPLVSQENIVATGKNSMLFYSNPDRPLFFNGGKVLSDFYVPKPYLMELNRDLPVFHYANTIGFLYNGRMYEFGVRTN